MRNVPDKSPDSHDAAAQPHAEALPSWITEELIGRTLKIWNPRYGGVLTRDDAIAIILSVSRLYGVLSRG